MTTGMTQLELSNSCFKDNVANGRGTVTLCHFCDLITDENNHFEGNSVKTDMDPPNHALQEKHCIDVFKDDLWGDFQCFYRSAQCCIIFNDAVCP